MSLDEFCESHVKLALAFSGGCDSSYLLSVLLDHGVEVGVYYVNTAFQADFELRDARQVVSELGAHLTILEADVLTQDEVCRNQPDRCYLCKRFIFGTIFKAMARDGYKVLVDGTNASDDPSRRPGFQALEELGVLSPLRLAGLSKDEIRKASLERGLFTGEKPDFSCLATKLDPGTSITRERLAEVAERIQDDPWVSKSFE